jgi:ribosomal protein S18 acetylase RimI-like enzyme
VSTRPPCTRSAPLHPGPSHRYTAGMRLDGFRPEDATEIAAWPASAAEAASWAGAAARWPVAAADILVWHDDPSVRTFVLHDGGQAVAYGEIWVDEEEREIELARIIVRPDRRGQGAGRLLVQLLLARSQDFGLPVAFVRVVPANTAALACYQGAGLTLVSEQERQASNRGQPVDYVWLRRDFGKPAGAG